MKKFLIRLLIYLVVFSVWSFYRLDGFLLSKIWANKSDIKEIVPNAEIKKILTQKFSYLSKGHQCFAFVSQDGKYVIKLLNQRRFNLPWQIKPFIFLSSIRELDYSRNARKRPSFESYKIAYQYLKEETKILYIQMDEQKRFHQFINIKDKANNEHVIDLFDVEFVLQKKVIPIYVHLTYLYHKNKIKFKRAISSFLDIVVSRVHKNIVDDDLDIQINYGFIKENAVLIDPGRLTIDNHLSNFSNRKSEVIKSTKQIREWINQNYPEMISFFDETLLSKLNH